jgi:small-conductance mechanosensitive channel
MSGPKSRRTGAGRLRLPQRSDVPDTIGAALPEKEGELMNILLIVVGIIAVALLLTGGFFHALNFLLWVGLVLAIIALIVWLARVITGRRAV